jgi:uncharacterized membrane protein YgdD (TMEM256/DUF423 family)
MLTAAGAWARIGAMSAMVAVAAGAFGAHALRARVEARALEVWETAARYQMYHALALLFVAWLATSPADGDARRDARVGRPYGPAVRLAGWAFVVGTVLFSGSLYLMTLTGQTWLGAITPLGGVAFLVGWAAVVWGVGLDRRPGQG